MQDLLKDYLVEHIEEEKVYFSLTCAICGNNGTAPLWRRLPSVAVTLT
jgi:hypothetical protein